MHETPTKGKQQAAIMPIGIRISEAAGNLFRSRAERVLSVFLIPIIGVALLSVMIPTEPSRAVSSCFEPAFAAPVQRGTWYYIGSFLIGAMTVVVGCLGLFWRRSGYWLLFLVGSIVAIYVTTNSVVNYVLNVSFGCSFLFVRFAIRDLILLMFSFVLLNGSRVVPKKVRTLSVVVILFQFAFISERIVQSIKQERYFLSDMLLSGAAAYWLFQMFVSLSLLYFQRLSRPIQTLLALTSLFFFPIWMLHSRSFVGPLILVSTPIAVFMLSELKLGNRDEGSERHRTSSSNISQKDRQKVASHT